MARERLLPRRPVLTEEELAGYTAAFLALAVVSLLVVGTNAFALVFVLPSLHAWLWLPQVRGRGTWPRALLVVAGFLGPLLLLWSLGSRYGLGLHAPGDLPDGPAPGALGQRFDRNGCRRRRFALEPAVRERPSALARRTRSFEVRRPW